MSSRKRTTRTTTKVESLKRAKAAKDALSQDETWRHKAINRIYEINKVLAPYRERVNNIVDANLRKLAAYRSANLNDLTLLSRKSNEVYHNLTVLEIRRLKAVEKFVEFTEKHPMHFAQGPWQFQQHFANLEDNKSVDDLLSHLLSLREECVSHIDRVVDSITQRKEEYDLIFKEIDNEILKTKAELDDVTEQRKKLYEDQEFQSFEFIDVEFKSYTLSLT